MLTEEQIQRLTKKLSEEYELDEAICEKNVRFIDTISEVFHVLLPEECRERYKKVLEGEFFEGLIQKSFSLEKQIREIYWICRLKVILSKMSLSIDK